MRIEDRITILVCSCDSYNDLWPPFFTLLKKYWPDNNCKIILNTEYQTYKEPGLNIETFSLGKSPYGTRLLNHLERIDTPYTLLLLDDFFLRRPVDEKKLSLIIEKMDEDESISVFYCNKSDFVKKETNIYGFAEMLQYAPYKLNMQAGLWRTESLKKYWRPEDNPWIWEIFVNYTTFDTKDKFYSLIDLETSPIYYGYNPDGMGVFRGKWVKNDVCPLFEKHSIHVDYAKRGYYEPDNAVARLPIMETMPYVFKRIPFKYALPFSLYEVMKRVLRIFGKRPKFLNYTEYMAYTHNK